MGRDTAVGIAGLGLALLLFVLERADVTVPDELLWPLGALAVGMMLWGAFAAIRPKQPGFATETASRTLARLKRLTAKRQRYGGQAHRSEVASSKATLVIELVGYEFGRRSSSGSYWGPGALNQLIQHQLVLMTSLSFVALPRMLVERIELEVLGHRLPSKWESEEIVGAPGMTFSVEFPVTHNIPAGDHKVRLVAWGNGNEWVSTEQIITFAKPC